jgi:hypothetical protein
MICKKCDSDFSDYELLENNKNLEYKLLTKNFLHKQFPAEKKYDIVLIENQPTKNMAMKSV